LVILWGAYVRATGSGAGCGSHWPLCNGVVIPRDAQLETMVEFTHRLTSGLNGILVIILLVWVFRRFAKGHIARLGAALSTFFILTEGAVGAGLVLLELVADNDSQARAIWVAAHLVNTFLLLAALTLTAWWVSGGRPMRWPDYGREGWLLAIGLLALLFVGASGAITALGDTLFPSASLTEGIAQDFSATAHFLIRLRVWHPVLAILTGVYLIVISSFIYNWRPAARSANFRRAIQLLVVAQLAAGALNVVLLAPVWMQLLHLLLADLLWIALTLFAAATLVEEVPVKELLFSPKPAGD
jgi:heme A synthase